jgi:hypothetical protein
LDVVADEGRYGWSDLVVISVRDQRSVKKRQVARPTPDDTIGDGSYLINALAHGRAKRPSVHRFAAQLDCVSIRVSESEVQLVALELKRPVDYCAIPQEAAFEDKGTAVHPTPLVGDATTSCL